MMTRTAARWNGQFAFITGSVAVCILVGLLGVWGMQSRIAGAVIAPGVIKVESNRQVIQHPDGGVVSEIFVRNGDVVQAGEVLLRLDETDIRSELAIIEQQLVELIARIARLKSERDSKTEYEVSFSGFEHIPFKEVEEARGVSLMHAKVHLRMNWPKLARKSLKHNHRLEVLRRRSRR